MRDAISDNEGREPRENDDVLIADSVPRRRCFACRGVFHYNSRVERVARDMTKIETIRKGVVHAS